MGLFRMVSICAALWLALPTAVSLAQEGEVTAEQQAEALQWNLDENQKQLLQHEPIELNPVPQLIDEPSVLLETSEPELWWATPRGPPLLSQQIEASINEELARRNQILFGQIERVQHLASARIEWLTLHDTLSLSALGLYNFSTQEWLLYPKIAYQLADGLSATLGGEIYAGPSNTLLDLIDEQLTAGYVELRASF